MTESNSSISVRLEHLEKAVEKMVDLQTRQAEIAANISQLLSDLRRTGERMGALESADLLIRVDIGRIQERMNIVASVGLAVLSVVCGVVLWWIQKH